MGPPPRRRLTGTPFWVRNAINSRRKYQLQKGEPRLTLYNSLLTATNFAGVELPTAPIERWQKASPARKRTDNKRSDDHHHSVSVFRLSEFQDLLHRTCLRAFAERVPGVGQLSAHRRVAKPDGLIISGCLITSHRSAQTNSSSCLTGINRDSHLFSRAE